MSTTLNMVHHRSLPIYIEVAQPLHSDFRLGLPAKRSCHSCRVCQRRLRIPIRVIQLFDVLFWQQGEEQTVLLYFVHLHVLLSEGAASPLYPFLHLLQATTLIHQLMSFGRSQCHFPVE